MRQDRLAEAATGMLIAHAAWLDPDDFIQFIHADPAAETAAIDWTAAITALITGNCPAQTENRRCSA